MNIQYWNIGEKNIPDWIQNLIDRKLLVEKEPTSFSICWAFFSTPDTNYPIYLYDGDALYFIDNKIGIIFENYKNFDLLKKRISVKKFYCEVCGQEIENEKNIWTIKIQSNDERKNLFYPNKKRVCPKCKKEFDKIINP